MSWIGVVTLTITAYIVVYAGQGSRICTTYLGPFLTKELHEDGDVIIRNGRPGSAHFLMF